MKKYLLLAVCALSLTAASCDLFPSKTAGVLKTSNGGIDWQATNTLKDNKGDIAGLSISKLAFDPQATDIIYASSNNSGIYKSNDGGSTWEQILGQIPILDFVVHPTDSQTIYAAGQFDNRGRALITKDGGKSWNAIYTAANSSTSVRSIAVNPNSPQQVAIGMSQGELILSNDGGATWRLAQSYNDRINKILWLNDAMYVLVKGTGIFKSVDSGSTFQLITASLQSSGNTLNLSIFGNSISQFNQMAASLLNPSTIYVTTNLGLYRTTNGGGSWSFVSMPLHKESAPPVALAIAPSSDNVLYVSSGTNVFKTTDGGNSWSSVDTKVTGSVNALLIDPNLPQVAFAGVY